MSPFTKVYNQSNSGGGLRQSGNAKQRSGQIRTGGMGRGVGGSQPKRAIGGSHGPTPAGEIHNGIQIVRPGQQ